MGQNLIDTLNSAISNAVDKEDETYEALFGKEEFDPKPVIRKSADYQCGSVANELEFMRRVSNYFVQSFDLEVAQGENLEKLINAFVNLPRRNKGESDAAYRDRFRAIAVARNNPRRTTAAALRDAMSYFLGPKSKSQIVEKTTDEGTSFQLRIKGAQDTSSSAFLNDDQQSFMNQQFIGGGGIGGVISNVGEVLDIIRSVGIKTDTAFIEQGAVTKLLNARIGSVQIAKLCRTNVLGPVTIERTIDAIVVYVRRFTKTIEARIGKHRRTFDKAASSTVKRHESLTIVANTRVGSPRIEKVSAATIKASYTITKQSDATVRTA